jgi:hypothetical protein
MWAALSGSLEAIDKLSEAMVCLKRALICQDSIEVEEFARLAQLYNKQFEKDCKQENFENIAKYYKMYIDEHVKESGYLHGEYIEEAITFLVKFYKEKGDIEQMHKYKKLFESEY